MVLGCYPKRFQMMRLPSFAVLASTDDRILYSQISTSVLLYLLVTTKHVITYPIAKMISSNWRSTNRSPTETYQNRPRKCYNASARQGKLKCINCQQSRIGKMFMSRRSMRFCCFSSQSCGMILHTTVNGQFIQFSESAGECCHLSVSIETE